MTRAHFQHFYVHPENIHKKFFILNGEEFMHAVKVLRKNKGDSISAVDGCGNLFVGTIHSIENNLLKVEISNKEKNIGEPELFLTLAQAVPKGSGFDFVIEKGTEIGLSAFQPIITSRSIVNADSRILRWKKKSLTAMKQCGRSRCPDILESLDFEKTLRKYQRDVLIIAHERYINAQVEYLSKISIARRTTLFIGPEGGFTEDEFQLALNYGALPMNLGPRRLRSETAGLVGVIKILNTAQELQ